MFKRDYLISSINDFIPVLKKIKDDSNSDLLWYRGQGDSDWKLIPNIFRKKRTRMHSEYLNRDIVCKNDVFDYPDFQQMLSDFKQEMEKYGNVILENEFDLMCIGQHYGLLTPLLDFSTDPLVALFFCIEHIVEGTFSNLDECKKQFDKESYVSDAGTIFVLSPKDFNSKATDVIYENGNSIEEIEYNDESECMKSYITRINTPKRPLCFTVKKKEYRMIRQSGNFLCYGNDDTPIDYYPNCKEFLCKIFIPYCLFSEFKDCLSVLDITKKSLYDSGLPYENAAKKAISGMIYK